MRSIYSVIASKPAFSRNTSTNTITQFRPSPTLQHAQLATTLSRYVITPHQDAQRPGSNNKDREAESSSPEAASSSSSSSESDSEADVRASKSQMLRRPSRFTAGRRPPQKGGGQLEQHVEEDETLAFLPVSSSGDSTQDARPHQKQDIGATVRGPQLFTDSTLRPSESGSIGLQQTSTGGESSASSSASAAIPVAQLRGSQGQRPPISSSTGHRAQLTKLSPRGRGKAREGSEGTPSMGSSFSDLDGMSASSTWS